MVKYLKAKCKQINNRFKSLIINKFAPDYYNLKSENNTLRKDIYILIKSADYDEYMQVLLKWQMKYKYQEDCMLGDSQSQGDGFVNHITDKNSK